MPTFSSSEIRRHIGLLLVLLSLSLFFHQASAQLSSTEQNSVPTIPNSLSATQVDEFVAPLSDNEVRAVLIQELKNQESRQPSANTKSVIDLLFEINNPYTELGYQVHNLFAATDSFWHEIRTVFIELTDNGGWGALLKIIMVIILMVAAGYMLFWYIMRKVNAKLCCHAEYKAAKDALQHQNSINNVDSDNGAHAEVEVAPTSSTKIKLQKPSWLRSLTSLLTRFVAQLTALFIAAVLGHIIAGMFIDTQSNQYVLLTVITRSIIEVCFFAILFGLLFNPSPFGFELICPSLNLKKLFMVMLAFAVFYIFGFYLIELMTQHGLPQAHTTICRLFVAIVLLNPLVLYYAWSERRHIDALIFTGNAGNTGNPFSPSRVNFWPSLVTILILIAVLNWAIQIMVGDDARRKAIVLAWWVTLLFPLVDIIVSTLLGKMMMFEIFQHPRFQKRKQRFVGFIRNFIRLIMLALLLSSMFEAWGFSIINKLSSSTGQSIVGAITDIGVTLLFGYILWEAIQLWMERNLPEESDESPGEIEGEGGGVAATRKETLLPLFRSILLVTLVVVVVLSILYSLGVKIGPLLAGAGVVGIAVGLGAQKLVQDVISGMFFLIDDAFRKGEYVELASMRGTVEKLSVRSMQLRHHLGAVQTIPYGEITAVKNLSRDWVIMKLELRLPYDVDIEKVRKIIKKVGQEMLQDEEIGPNMLQPLKSQGVMRMEESALIIRMKFTAKPGEQWIIRRVAYTRVRDALAQQGIHFAHREVKVSLADLPHIDIDTEHNDSNQEQHSIAAPSSQSPQQPKEKPANSTMASPNTNPADSRIEKLVEKQLPNIAGAAAMSAITADELKRQEKLDPDQDDGEDR